MSKKGMYSKVNQLNHLHFFPNSGIKCMHCKILLCCFFFFHQRLKKMYIYFLYLNPQASKAMVRKPFPHGCLFFF